MVIIGASQALDPGSIPGERTRLRIFGGISSIGRVRALQARGTGIETPMLQSHFARGRSFCHPVGHSPPWNRSGSSVGRAWV